MPTDKELSASIDSAIASLNLSLNSEALSEEMYPNLDVSDLLKVRAPTIAEMFGLNVNLPEASVMPSLSTQAADGIVTLDEPDLPTDEALIKQDPHTIQHITKYVSDVATKSRTEINTGKTEYIAKLATIIKQNQSVDGADKNLFLLTGNSGLTNDGIDALGLDEHEDYAFDLLSNISVGGINNIIVDGSELYSSPLYNESEIKNGLVVIKPRYPKVWKKSNLSINDGENAIYITTNKSTDEANYNFYRDVQRGDSVTINILDQNGESTGEKTTYWYNGDVTLSSTLSISAPQTIVGGVTSGKEQPRYQDFLPAANPIKVHGNLSSGSVPGPGAFSTFKFSAAENKMLAQHIPMNLVGDKQDGGDEGNPNANRFVDSDIGIIRAGEEISITRTEPTKIELIPQYYVDKENITYEVENGKPTGLIKETEYLAPTIAFGADADDDNTRYDPYGTTGAETNKQLNFDESQAITTVKKSDFYTKIANKWDILFHENYGGIKPDPSKLDFGMGKILVIRNASESADADGNWIYNIPFQFSPELTGESRSANWSTHTALGRTNDYFIWSNTASRTVQLRTTYAIIAPESNDPAWFKDGRNGNAINSTYGEWGKYWTETVVSGILAKYRKLVLPENYTPNTSLSDGNRLSPPIIIVSFGTDMDTKFSDSAAGKTRWLVSDINIDTKLEAGWTSAKNPRMYEISLTLREVAPSWRSYQTHAQF